MKMLCMDDTNSLRIDLYKSSNLNKTENIVRIKVIEGNTLLITDTNDFPKNIKTIEFDDLIGLEVSQLTEECSKLKIYSTNPVNIESKIHKTNKTDRKENNLEYYAKNFTILQEFRDHVLRSLWESNKKKYNSGIDSNDTTYSKTKGFKDYEKKILAVINPKSGKKLAESIFKQAEPILKSNGFIIDTLKTTHKNHAKEYIQGLDKEILKGYYSILCFSGDGTVHELLNGFYNRPDSQDLDLRLAPFLGGTVNTMNLNSLKEWNLTATLLNMIYVTSRARFMSSTVTKYVTNNLDNHVIYGLVGYNFGYYADLDLFREQKRFWWLGKYALECYSVFKLLFNLSKRKATIWTSEESLDIQSNAKLDSLALIEDESYLEGWEKNQDNLYNFIYLTSPEWTSIENISENREMGCGYGEALVNTEKEGYMSFINSLIGIGDKNLEIQMPEKVKKVRSFRVKLDDSIKEDTHCNIDGELYKSSVLQGTVLNNNIQVKIIA